eukprot:TRINITY_DN85004_c0_g1_i1.p1 TRINITY_DN85004_c0_g1~~TRINITY_DN85004_c0_g1_i1.p1  ORF type:complete len:130 (+),score=31.88 TRINITY_DN85004_c0_g1_i1:138-527(+)
MALSQQPWSPRWNLPEFADSNSDSLAPVAVAPPLPPSPQALTPKVALDFADEQGEADDHSLKLTRLASDTETSTAAASSSAVTVKRKLKRRSGSALRTRRVFKLNESDLQQVVNTAVKAAVEAIFSAKG